MSDVRTDRGKWPLKSLPAKAFVFVLVTGLARVLIEGGVAMEASSEPRRRSRVWRTRSPCA
jgi:hypothetical protein